MTRFSSSSFSWVFRGGFGMSPQRGDPGRAFRRLPAGHGECMQPNAGTGMEDGPGDLSRCVRPRCCRPHDRPLSGSEVPLINNWYPMDVVKRTLCGTLHEFNFYDGLGREADWNNYVIPSAAFNHLLEDARAYAHRGRCGTAEQRKTASRRRSPGEALLREPLLPQERGQSPREGKPLCTYGPWVGEKLHGFRRRFIPRSSSGGARRPAESSSISSWSLRTTRTASTARGTTADPPSPELAAVGEVSLAPRSSACFRVEGRGARSNSFRPVGRTQRRHQATAGATISSNTSKPVLRLVERQAREEDVGCSLRRGLPRSGRDASARLCGDLHQGRGRDEDGMEGFAVLRVGPDRARCFGCRRLVRGPPRVLLVGGIGGPTATPRGSGAGVSDSARELPESIVSDATLSSGSASPYRPLCRQAHGHCRGARRAGVSSWSACAPGRQVPIVLPGLGIAPVVTALRRPTRRGGPLRVAELMGSALARVPTARTALPQNLTLKTEGAGP